MIRPNLRGEVDRRGHEGVVERSRQRRGNNRGLAHADGAAHEDVTAGLGHRREYVSVAHRVRGRHEDPVQALGLGLGLELGLGLGLGDT